MTFEDWWNKNGKYYDPDTSDISWFDKRKDLAAYAFDAGILTSRQTALPVVLPPPPEGSLEICRRCGFVKDLHEGVSISSVVPPICSQFLPQNKGCGANEAGGVVPVGGRAGVIESRGVSVELPVHLL